MFTLFRHLTERQSCPIGLDLGTHTLKVVQAERVRPGETGAARWRVAAAASVPVPAGTWSDSGARRAFFAGAVRQVLAAAGCRGRQAVLALPAAATFVTGLRLPLLPAGSMGGQVSEALAGMLPFPVRHAVVRHVVAGDAYDAGELRRGVVAMAVRRGLVEDCLAAAAAAGLRVVAMPCEPLALLAALPTSVTAAGDTRLIVDLSAGGTRVYASRQGRLVFARRLDAGTSSEAAVCRMAGELRMCRHYVEALPGRLVGEIMFVGGGAHRRVDCERLAGALGLPMRIADGRASSGESTPDASGPEWAVATGASLGSHTGRVPKAAA